MAPQPPEQRIAGLRKAVADRQRDRARADLELAAAREREQAALKVLAEEFGVSDLEAAAALLKAKQDDLDQACAEAETALREAGS